MKFAQIYSHKHSLKTKLRGDMTDVTDVFFCLDTNLNVGAISDSLLASKSCVKFSLLINLS